MNRFSLSLFLIIAFSITFCTAGFQRGRRGGERNSTNGPISTNSDSQSNEQPWSNRGQQNGRGFGGGQNGRGFGRGGGQMSFGGQGGQQFGFGGGFPDGFNGGRRKREADASSSPESGEQQNGQGQQQNAQQNGQGQSGRQGQQQSNGRRGFGNNRANGPDNPMSSQWQNNGLWGSGRAKRQASPQASDIQELYNLTRTSEKALLELLNTLNRTQRIELLQIVTQSRSMSRHQLEAATDAWAAQQGSPVQQEYQQYKQSVEQLLEELEEIHNQAAANLSSEARSVDQQIVAILSNSSLNKAQQCQQIRTILANTAQQIQRQLRQTFGALPCQGPRGFGGFDSDEWRRNNGGRGGGSGNGRSPFGGGGNRAPNFGRFPENQRERNFFDDSDENRRNSGWSNNQEGFGQQRRGGQMGTLRGGRFGQTNSAGPFGQNGSPFGSQSLFGGGQQFGQMPQEGGGRFNRFPSNDQQQQFPF